MTIRMCPLGILPLPMVVFWRSPNVAISWCLVSHQQSYKALDLPEMTWNQTNRRPDSIRSPSWIHCTQVCPSVISSFEVNTCIVDHNIKYDDKDDYAIRENKQMVSMRSGSGTTSTLEESTRIGRLMLILGVVDGGVGTAAALDSKMLDCARKHSTPVNVLANRLQVWWYQRRQGM
jgi:hypothetical protein